MEKLSAVEQQSYNSIHEQLKYIGTVVDQAVARYLEAPDGYAGTSDFLDGVCKLLVPVTESIVEMEETMAQYVVEEIHSAIEDHTGVGRSLGIDLTELSTAVFKKLRRAGYLCEDYVEPPVL